MVRLIVLARPCLALLIGPAGCFTLSFFVFGFGFVVVLSPFKRQSFRDRFLGNGRVSGLRGCRSSCVIVLAFVFAFARGVPSNCPILFLRFRSAAGAHVRLLGYRACCGRC